MKNQKGLSLFELVFVLALLGVAWYGYVGIFKRHVTSQLAKNSLTPIGSPACFPKTYPTRPAFVTRYQTAFEQWGDVAKDPANREQKKAASTDLEGSYSLPRKDGNNGQMVGWGLYAVSPEDWTPNLSGFYPYGTAVLKGGLVMWLQEWEKVTINDYPHTRLAKYEQWTLRNDGSLSRAPAWRPSKLYSFAINFLWFCGADNDDHILTFGLETDQYNVRQVTSVTGTIEIATFVDGEKWPSQVSLVPCKASIGHGFAQVSRTNGCLEGSFERPGKPEEKYTLGQMLLKNQFDQQINVHTVNGTRLITLAESRTQFY